MKKIFLVLITILSAITLIGCSKTLNVFPKEHDFRSLQISLEKLFSARSEVVVVNSLQEAKDVSVLNKYILKTLDDRITKAVNDAYSIITSKNYTNESKNKINKQLNDLYTEVLKARSGKKQDSDLLNTFDKIKYNVNIDNFPDSYINFYFATAENLKAKIDFSKSDAIAKLKYANKQLTLLKTLIDFDLKNQKQEAINFVKDNMVQFKDMLQNNPFNSLKPRFENLPANTNIYYLNLSQGHELLKNVKAYDFLDEEITPYIYLRQDMNIHKVGQYDVQIAVEDKYKALGLSDKTYTFSVVPKMEKPRLIISTTHDVFGFGKSQDDKFDVRDLVLAKNYFDLKIPNEFIKYEVYNSLGDLVDFTNKANRVPGKYKIRYQVKDNLNNTYSEYGEKQITILPQSPNTNSTVIEENDFNFSFKDLTFEELNKFKDITKIDKLLYEGTLPLSNSLKLNGINQNAHDNLDKDLIIYDEVSRYINNKHVVGFNQMTYDLMPYLDKVVMMSNSNITIPLKNEINMFHKNGVKLFGRINIPFSYAGGNKNMLLKLAEQDENGNFINSDILANILSKFNFDGWSISINVGLYEDRDNLLDVLPKAEVEEYLAEKRQAKKELDEKILPFLKDLYKKVHALNKEIIFEQGLTDTGAILDYKIVEGKVVKQKEFKESEKIFLGDKNDLENKVADFFVTNPYNLGLKMAIEDSVNNIKSLNHSEKDLYSGFFLPYTRDDIISIGEMYQIFDNKKLSGKLLSSIAIYNVSNYLFNIKTGKFNYDKMSADDPNNIYRSNDYYAYFDRVRELIKGSDSYKNCNFDEYDNIDKSDLKNEAKFELALKHFKITPIFNEKTVINSDEFLTNFNTNNYQDYFIDGVSNKKESKEEFAFSGSNYELQDVLPTYYEINYHNENTSKIKVSYSHDIAYQGTSSLMFSGVFIKKNPFDVKLYATNIPVHNDTKVTTYIYYTKNISPKLVLELKDSNGNITKEIVTLRKEGSGVNKWIKFTADLKAYNEKTIVSIGYEFTATSAIETYSHFNIGELRIYRNENAPVVNNINNFKIQEIENDKQLFYQFDNKASAILEFNKLEGNYLYKVYQRKNNKLYFLEATYNNQLLVKDITRFRVDPNNQFPTISDYDTNFELVIRAYDEMKNVVGEATLTDLWKQELIKGGKAKLNISSAIAAPKEIIMIKPVISKLTKNVNLEFIDGNPTVKKLSDGSYQVTYPKEGYYTIKYTATNDNGSDVLELRNLFVVSNEIPKESDLTSDAFIDDRDEMKGIKYSSYVNKGERPSLMIDSSNGGPNLYTKWCSNDKGPGQRWTIIDFSDVVTVTKFALSHAACSKSNSFDMNNFAMNTIEYEIYGSLDGINWTLLVHRENNKDTFTVDKLDEPAKVKHLKLNVVNGGADITARIYDMRIYGSR